MATLFTSSSSVIDDDDASFSSSDGFLPTPSTSSAAAAAAAAADDDGTSSNKDPTQQTTHATTFHLYHEVKHLIHLTLPSVLVQLCLYFIFPQAASVVGREFGSEALAGFSLGTLVGNMTVLSIVVGALTAADTLMPRAFATGKYDELGILLIQSLVVCTLLLILPLIPLCTVMEPILLFFGQDPIASQLASEWIRVYLWGVPANVVFRVMQRFLVAQHQPWPPVFCAAIPCFLVQPILLPILTSSRLQFIGSAVSIVITQWTVTILLGIQTYCCPVHHPDSWPNYHHPTNSWNRAWKSSSLRRFISLSIGGVLSLSEWWFWETMCFIAGSFGVEALCAHTIAYNMIPLLYMIPLGFSIGLTVRMGHTLSCRNIYTAKRIAAWCMGGVAVLGSIVSILMWSFRDNIIGLFITKYNHPLVLEETKQIWPMVCIYIFVLYIFGINGSILKGLGLQWNLATWIFVCLWCGLLPCVVYWAMIRQGGLQVQWTLLPTFYVILQLCLIVNYSTADWKQIMIRQQQRRQREASLRASSRRSLMKDTIDDDDDDDVVMVSGSGDNTTSPHQAPDEKTPLVLSSN